MGSLKTFVSFVTVIVIQLNTTPASPITTQFRRHIGPPPPKDWEIGLREATHQALLRERISDPSLHDRLLSAPLVGRQESATPFGDIAILARGQLYASPNGYKFLQDPYRNDCDECHNHLAQNYQSGYRDHGNRLLALWTVKRIRHRDHEHGHVFEIEYTISPVTRVITDRGLLFQRDGHYNYNIPGHVFVIRSDPRLNSAYYASQGDSNHLHHHQGIKYHQQPHHNHYHQGVLLGVTPDGYNQVLQTYPGLYSSYRGPSTVDPKEYELYKKLIESLASKTQTPPHRFAGSTPEPVQRQPTTTTVFVPEPVQGTTVFTPQPVQRQPTTTTAVFTAEPVPKQPTTTTVFIPEPVQGTTVFTPRPVQRQPTTTTVFVPTTFVQQLFPDYTTSANPIRFPGTTTTPKVTTTTPQITTKPITTIHFFAPAEEHDDLFGKPSTLPMTTANEIDREKSSSNTQTQTTVLVATTKPSTATNERPVPPTRPMRPQTTIATTQNRPDSINEQLPPPESEERNTETTIPYVLSTTVVSETTKPFVRETTRPIIRETTTRPIIRTTQPIIRETTTKPIITRETTISTPSETTQITTTTTRRRKKPTTIVEYSFDSTTAAITQTTNNPTTEILNLPTTETVNLPTTETLNLPTTETLNLPTTETLNLPTTQTIVIPVTTTTLNTETPSTTHFIPSTEESTSTVKQTTSPYVETSTPFKTTYTTARVTKRPSSTSDFLSDPSGDKSIYSNKIPDLNEDDIFGTKRATKQTTTATTKKTTENGLSNALFGGGGGGGPRTNRRSKQLRLPRPKPTKSKVIYSDFYSATQQETTLRPSTEQSVSTSISFEVNKRSNGLIIDHDSERMHLEAPVMADLKEVVPNRDDYKIYKAELSSDSTAADGNHVETKKVFDDFALQLVNHAKSIDYLNSRSGKTKQRRRSPATKSKRGGQRRTSRVPRTTTERTQRQRE